MIELSDAMRSKILEVLTPLLESLTNCALEPSAVYGIREYQRGASLAMHADRIDTHLVSAIINVAQQVNTDWPICIQDHTGKSHEVLLKPGEMLFYQSARLEHGRPTPLDGDFYANIFTHTRPLSMEQSVSKAIV
jgi:prolyl 4-hydroxylase